MLRDSNTIQSQNFQFLTTTSLSFINQDIMLTIKKMAVKDRK